MVIITKALTFEQALIELKQLTDKATQVKSNIPSNLTLDLEYTRGISLINYCQEQLQQAYLKVQADEEPTSSAGSVGDEDRDIISHQPNSKIDPESNFEAAVTELQLIASKLPNINILDQFLKLYERSRSLKQYCINKLNLERNKLENARQAIASHSLTPDLITLADFEKSFTELEQLSCKKPTSLAELSQVIANYERMQNLQQVCRQALEASELSISRATQKDNSHNGWEAHDRSAHSEGAHNGGAHGGDSASVACAVDMMGANLSFEESLKQLEAVVAGVTVPNLRLDEIVSKYKQGLELKKLCAAKLEEETLKIKNSLHEAPMVENQVERQVEPDVSARVGQRVIKTSFEEALEELMRITHKSSPQQPAITSNLAPNITTIITNYEHGLLLKNYCQNHIEAAEQQLTELTHSAKEEIAVTGDINRTTNLEEAKLWETLEDNLIPGLPTPQDEDPSSVAPTFEQALQEIEVITERMQGAIKAEDARIGDIKIEAMINCYARAMLLQKYCTRKIHQQNFTVKHMEYEC